ncbi:restriction endonuclease subunit S [Agarivorans litoreus]|uniref:restriction endonuclease subunit S n=1 Tax=Agarivorans litoreus TaxID=1510455 RepID=UPI001C7DD0F6|nr:restriction endonuclease subunit S [Agarivorans litoreus]
MSELPKGWVETELGDVTNYGATIKPDLDKIDDSCWVLELEDIEKDSSKLLKRLSFGERAPKSSKNSFVKGDVLYGKLRPYLNKMLIAPEDGVCTTEIVPLKISNDLFENRFLFYWLKGKQFSDYVNAVSYGVNMPRLGTKDGKRAPMVVAPLAEQKRIVEKLDEVLAQVDTIKARLDGIPALLKTFRQSVLASAVSGKLTEEWRGKGDYREDYLGEGWKWDAVPSNWTAKFYPELVDSRLGKMLDKNKNVGEATKYLGNINVRWFDTDLSKVQEILVSDREKEELSLFKGDVLICEGGEPGRCCVWSKDSEEVIIFQKALHRARVKQEILPEWLVYNLKNDADSLILNQLFTGTTIKHLTGKALRRYPIRVPLIEEQKEIVRLVDQYFAFADTIEKQVSLAQARVDNLTQSILAKAFRGELVEQDPNDEPADQLLARIAKARADAEALAKAAKKAEAARKKAAKASANS